MKKKYEITAELTPLLDVILIMLFFIMSVNSQTIEKEKANTESQIAQISEEYSERENELKNSLAESEKNRLDAENRIESYQTFEEYSVIISIGVFENQDSDDTRSIILSSGEKSEYIKYDWNNMKYAENSLDAILKKYIINQDNNPVFIVFNFNSDNIYMRDYNMISSVINNIQRENIYIHYNERTI